MDWDFLNIFKKADFNILMIAASVMFWVLYILYPDNMYILGGAILCSVYCFLRFIIFIWDVVSSNNQYEEREEYNKRKEEIESINQRRNAQYVLDKQGEETQKILIEIVRKGRRSSFPDVYILDNYVDFCVISQLENKLYDDGDLHKWVNIERNSDTCSIIISSPLNKIIEEIA